MPSGVSLTWFGFYINTLALAPTTGTYAIDGQSPITFNLDGQSANGTGLEVNQIFFQTGQLSAGMHTLDVVYQGNSQTAPLTLSQLFVQNNASSLSSTSGTSNNTSSSTSNATSIATSGTPVATSSTPNPAIDTPNHSNHLGPIIGGVIGGLALIIFAILTIFFLCRRRKDRSQKVDAIVKPFNDPPTAVFSPLTLNDYRDTNNASSLSPPSLTPKHTFSSSASMAQADNATPLSIQALREQRKGQQFIDQASRSRQETQAAHLSPSSSTTTSHPTRFVNDQDAGIQLSTNQQGEVVGLLPPAYSF